MLCVVESDLSFLRLGENRARNKTRSIITSQVRIAEFKITHSGAADANKSWSIESVFSSRATLEAGIDYRKRLQGSDRQHGTGPPPAFAYADDPDPDRSTRTKFADAMNIHLAVFPPLQILRQ